MIYSGKQDGSAIEWAFDDAAKTLTISGHGCMGDVLVSESYIDAEGNERQGGARKAPWDEFASIVERIEVHPDVLTIAPAAFYGFGNLVEARMPGVAIIGNGAFYLCKNLELVQIPNAMMIGASAFERCEKLSKMLVWQEGEKKQGYVRRTRILMRNTMNIGNYAFANAKSLGAISMERCSSIGKYAFYGCESLKEARFPSASQIVQGAFYGCEALNKVKLLEGCTIGKDAFIKAGTNDVEYVSEESGE